MENRFKRLRYYDDLCIKQKYSMNELAKIMGISKATISKLEASDDYNANMVILKKYKEVFPDVSYDYLMGETGTMKKQYNAIEEKLPMNNTFYDNLETFLAPDEYIEGLDLVVPHNFFTGEYLTQSQRKFLLDAFFSDPYAIHSLFLETYTALKDLYISNLPENKNQTFYFNSKSSQINSYLFQISQSYLSFAQEVLEPRLKPHIKAELAIINERNSNEKFSCPDNDIPLPF